MVVACFKLLSAISCKQLTASFEAPCAEQPLHRKQGAACRPATSGGIAPHSSVPDNSNQRSSSSDSPPVQHGAVLAPAGTLAESNRCSSSSSNNDSSSRQGERSQAANEFMQTPTHTIGSTLTMKFKPSGVAAQQTEGGGWLQTMRQKRRQRQQARAITAQQMLQLPLFQDLAGAVEAQQQHSV